MSFTLNELKQIAKALEIDLPKKSTAKSATTLIKGVLGIMKDHAGDIIRWINENNPGPKISEQKMELYIKKVVDFIEKNYPRYDMYTMYELLEMFADEIREELSL